ncbi:benzoate 4-monooxygenase cytochrome P450 [Aspergillus steynii IBT 23096]|uniref:Benzoate 4-monooxygenase cytochrome P450 n=1 Tax=Aspergillus steynii IBT 23096 TaxID=1392250 RepID=A0A2I2GD80_9EURO|nr:benzoate 4-monooxygenase cytochrome P450 [Aspergillus steynii IBT 23096]PLB50811.1 benzoate 4-monooxygenase cytochrome P450 [Aspergillus steynii IBT 23096]
MALLLVSFILAWLFITPFATYLYDPKRLRKYPNQNFLSGLTSLAYVYERRKSFRTRDLRIQHERHPILRTGPSVLSFGSVSAIKDIYGHGSPCLKDDVYKLITGDHPHILNVVDKDDHARKRRMLSNAFATRNLEQWEFKITDKVEKMVTQFDKRCTNPLVGSEVCPDELTIDFRRWSNLFTFDAIADIAMTERLGLIESGTDLVKCNVGNGVQSLSLIESLHCGGRVVSRFVGAADWFHLLKGLAKIFSPHFRAHSDDFGHIVNMLTDARLEKHQKGEKLSDFLGCLIEDRTGKNRGLDRAEIKAETSILLDAGSDTTAIALTNVLYYLIKHPNALRKLREEVDVILTGEEIAPYAKVKSLPYLRACLDESLRISPPLPRGLERKTPPQGMEIIGEQITGGVTVSVPAYVAHRDPILFPKPDSYMPERWLDESEATKDMRAAFIPFTTGARACLGRNITMMEQQILVATLVHRYDFALPSNDWNLDWEEAFNLWPAKMPLKIWRRETQEA